MLGSELAAPIHGGRLQRLGEWFHERGENNGASELLEKASAAGAAVDALLLARCEWMADRYDPAIAAFEVARARSQDGKQIAYLSQCITAAKSEAAEKKKPATTHAGQIRQ